MLSFAGEFTETEMPKMAKTDIKIRTRVQVYVYITLYYNR